MRHVKRITLKKMVAFRIHTLWYGTDFFSSSCCWLVRSVLCFPLSSLKVPEGEFGLLFTDGSKFGRAEQLHLALLGLWAFEKKEKRLPQAGNLEEAEAVVKLAEEVMTIFRSCSDRNVFTAWRKRIDPWSVQYYSSATLVVCLCFVSPRLHRARVRVTRDSSLFPSGSLWEAEVVCSLFARDVK